ncbi:MAG: hypothetical protein N2Z23_04135 [Pyrinomonadaceae bacterium]|nr:hypothetical protein [Pyrinomonadaceae bacterium]MCX7639612.1 hypothetical protein [Pyrinomonadaceae bacterium]MDW8303370.1 hypothetical protein [Acidobacteriota bacterium]
MYYKLIQKIRVNSANLMGSAVNDWILNSGIMIAAIKRGYYVQERRV